MHPVLIELGPVTIYVYGFFIAAAFFAGMLFTRREAGLQGLDTALLPELGFQVLLSYLAGARFLYVLAHPGLFADQPLEALMLWNGGLMFQGGAVAAALAAAACLRGYGQPLRSWADAAAPGLALGLSLAGLACLTAPCIRTPDAAMPWLAMQTTEQAFEGLSPVHLAQVVTGLTVFVLVQELKPLLPGPGRIFGFCLTCASLFWFFSNLLDPITALQPALFHLNQTMAVSSTLLGLWLLIGKRRS